MYPPWSRFAISAIFLALLAVAVMGCGPEAARTRNGGTGGSYRPAAPPTVVSEPRLVVQPTVNIPYAIPGPLPTLRPAVPAATPLGNPVATANPTPQQPGVGSPTPGR